MQKLAVIVASSILALPALAQSGPPAGFFPPGMRNMGDLYIVFCTEEHWYSAKKCEQHRAAIWGQVCESGLANDVVNGPTNEASYIKTPQGMKWVGWRCEPDGELIPPGRRGYYNDGAFVEFKDNP